MRVLNETRLKRRYICDSSFQTNGSDTAEEKFLKSLFCEKLALCWYDTFKNLFRAILMLL